MLSGADGLDLLKLRRFKFAEDVKPTLDGSSGENILVGDQQISVGGHLAIFVSR